MKKKLSAYKRITIGMISLTCIAAGIATASFSFSWFTNTNNVTSNVTRPVEGHTAGAYFASGNGSKDDPYVITSPTHLYNLAWLYYIGYFKGEEPYFAISKDIDMNGWALPPIGTSTNPFNGHIDGNSHTISNLKVSNSFDELKSRKPSNVTEDDWNGTSSNKDKYGPTPNITGLFGYISKESSDKGTPTVENISISKETVNSVTSTVLTGIAAGYVNGTLNNIKIGDSTVTVADNTSAIDTYGNISTYTSVGYCEKEYRTSYTKYKTTLYEPNYIGTTEFDPTSGGSGDGNDWGGSIDLSSLSKRINYIAKSKNSGKTPSTYSEYSAFNASLYYYNRGFDWDTIYQYGQYVAIQASSYLPLNINLTTATISGTYTGDMGSYYTGGSNSTEPILDTNTGYITGKLQKGSATPRLHSKYFDSTDSTNGIEYSIYQADSKSTAYSTTKSDLEIGTETYSIYDIFQPKNISFFYVDTSGSSYRIKDTDNSSTTWSTTITSNSIDVANCGFGNVTTGYYDVKSKFAKMLSDEQTDTIISGSKINLNALQFFGPTTNAMSKSTYSDVKINETTYDSFEMVDGGIDFELSQKGSVKIVLGAYATSKSSSSTNSVLPAIYKVNRSSNNKTIESYKKITHVYESSGTYYYQYSDGTTDSIPSGATEICNLEKMYSGCFKQKCAYYIEIPLNSGDYWFGADDQKNMSSFVLYLDIGSNAGDSGSSDAAVTRTKVYEVLEQITEAFTYPTGVTVVGFSTDSILYDDNKTLTITLGETYSGSASMKRTGTDTADITVTDAATDTGLAYFDPELTVTRDSSTIDESSLVRGDLSTETTKRLTYFDYYQEEDKQYTMMYQFSQTKIDDAEYGDISASSAQTDKNGSTFGDSTAITEYIGDDGNKTTEMPSISMPDGQTQSTATVVDIRLSKDKPDNLSLDYKPTISTDTTNFQTTVAGYDFTLKNGNDPFNDYIATKGSSTNTYTLTVNGTTI